MLSGALWQHYSRVARSIKTTLTIRNRLGACKTGHLGPKTNSVEYYRK